MNKKNLLLTSLLLSVLLTGCVLTEQDHPTIEKKPIEIVKVEKEVTKEELVQKDGFDRKELSSRTHKGRTKEKITSQEAGKSLKNVIAFMREVPEDLSERKLLDLYYDGEILKKFGGDNDSPNLHEIGNWSNTYIKGVLTKEVRLDRERLLRHTESLIDKAVTRWAELQKNS